MLILVSAFLAGAFSVLAPCIIGLLPLLAGYGAAKKNMKRVVYVVIGLSLSIFVFTLLLKASTVLIDVPNSVWQSISGGLIILFGLSLLLPNAWTYFAGKLKLQKISARGQKVALEKGGSWGDFLLGASLGPIFNSCSPTYAFIVAGVLPTSTIRGVLYLITFIAGLALMIFIVAYFGQTAIKKLGWAVEKRGWFKIVLGTLFIAIGILIITGYDKTLLSELVEAGWFDWQVNLENKML